MPDFEITNEATLIFNDDTEIEVGHSIDQRSILMIVKYPGANIKGSVYSEIRVELNADEASKLFEVIRSKIDALLRDS